jgi:hypothetical protein
VHFVERPVQPFMKDDASTASYGELAQELRHKTWRREAVRVVDTRVGSRLPWPYSRPRAGAALAIFLELGDMQSV